MVYDYEAFTAVPTPTPALPSPVVEPTVSQVSSKAHRFWHGFRLRCLASAAACVLLLTLGQCWPEGAGYVKSQLIAEAVSPTELAARTMLRDICSGHAIPDAIAVFCQEVLDATN